MSSRPKPKPAGPVQSQDGIMQKFQEIMEDPDCAQALCDHVMPFLELRWNLPVPWSVPSVPPWNSMGCGGGMASVPGQAWNETKTTLVLDELVHHTADVDGVANAAGVGDDGDFFSPQRRLPMGTERSTIKAPFPASDNLLRIFAPKSTGGALSSADEVADSNSISDSWWVVTMRPISKFIEDEVRNLLFKWDGVVDVWSSGSEEISVQVTKRNTAVKLCSHGTVVQNQLMQNFEVDARECFREELEASPDTQVTTEPPDPQLLLQQLLSEKAPELPQASASCRDFEPASSRPRSRWKPKFPQPA